jgi:hypothetical protein
MEGFNTVGEEEHAVVISESGQGGGANGSSAKVGGNEGASGENTRWIVALGGEDPGG